MDYGQGMAAHNELYDSTAAFSGASFPPALETAQQINLELAEILEGSFDGILVTDGDGNVQFVNSSYERVAAIPRKKLLGHNMRDLINPVWMPNSVALVVIEKRCPVSIQQVTQDGRDIIVTGTPIFDANNNIKRIVINARDISEIYRLKEELVKAKSLELQQYQEILESRDAETEKLVIFSEKIKKVFALAERIAPFDATVLIQGESGVGKEEIARKIHRCSTRSNGPLITINCGAIPESLLESELFGYEKGAFTGASHTGKTGLLEAASGGTVFLDEIGETPHSFQVKLLRVLETKQIIRVGGTTPRTIDVRFIAATNRDLSKMVRSGSFREDLFYRLNVITIMVPPLRQRREDIIPLSLYFLNLYNKKYHQKKEIPPEVMIRLEEYEWEGNVRELRNTIENMVIMGAENTLQINEVPWIANLTRPSAQASAAPDTAAPANTPADWNKALLETERDLLLRAKAACSSTREMAHFLNIDQSTVVRKLRKHHLS